MRPFDLFFQLNSWIDSQNRSDDCYNSPTSNHLRINMERRTDQQTYLPIEMQFYISVMFLGLPDNIQEEKPSFFNFENNWLPTDGRTDRPTDGRMDGRTHPLIES